MMRSCMLIELLIVNITFNGALTPFDAVTGVKWRTLGVPLLATPFDASNGVKWRKQSRLKRHTPFDASNGVKWRMVRESLSAYAI